MRRQVMLLTLIIGASPTLAMEAIVSSHRNRVMWHEQNRITATVYKTEMIGGVAGNYWPSFENEAIRRLGQTFRCRGPILATVQLGLDNVDSGYRGLQPRKRPYPDCIVRLFKGGVDGALVIEKTVPGNALTGDMRFDVNLPSDMSILWYVEYEPAKQSWPITINAEKTDGYVHGKAYINRKPANQVDTEQLTPDQEPDLLMRVTRRLTLEAQREGDYVLWAAGPEKRIWMTPGKTIDLMLADDPAEPVRLAAARNERVSFQVTVTPRDGRRVNRAEITFDKLVNGSGAVISPVRAEWLRHSLDYRRGRTSGRLYPDPLAATNIAESLPGQPDVPLNQTFWVSIRVPAEAAPGIYRTTARVNVNNRLELSRAIELNVYPITLPKRTHTRTVLFRAEPDTGEMQRWWIRDLADFRIALGSPFYKNRHRILRDNNFNEAAYSIILGEEMQSTFVRAATLMNELGLDVTNVTPWADVYRILRGDNEAAKDAGREGVIRFFNTYYPILKQNGWVEQAYCRMPDELEPGKLEQCRDIADLFRKHAPGVNVLVTAMGTPNVDHLSRGIGIADIWCPSIRYFALTLDFHTSRQKEGERVCPYIHDFTWHPMDPAACRMFFWMLEKHSMDGVCYFSIKRSAFEKNWFGVERRTDTWPGDGDLYYDAGLPRDSADDMGLWRSVRLYRIGDGLEDREYFHMLREAVKAAEQEGRFGPPLRQRWSHIIKRMNGMTPSVLSFSNDMAEVESIPGEIVHLLTDLEK